MTIMEILARDGSGAVSDVAREVGIHKSTASRLLATLERSGAVERHPATGRYRLGFTLVRLAAGVRGSLDLAAAARVACEHLSRDTDETVHLAVLEADEVVHVNEVNLSSQLVSVNWLGRHTALHATSSGKVFLAHLPPRAVDEILGATLERLTSTTIVDPQRLRAQLDDVRRDGFARTEEELEDGLNAVAAPIRGQDGEVIACVSVSGPSYRLTPERLAEIGARTVHAATEISGRLGFVQEPDTGT